MYKFWSFYYQWRNFEEKAHLPLFNDGRMWRVTWRRLGSASSVELKVVAIGGEDELIPQGDAKRSAAGRSAEAAGDGGVMKTLIIYGASDDLIEAKGDIDGCDEFYAGSGGPVCGVIEVTDATEFLNIYCLYDGCWSFSVSPWPNEDRLPWEMRRTWGKHTPYSETLEIDVPDSAKLTYRKR